MKRTKSGMLYLTHVVVLTSVLIIICSAYIAASRRSDRGLEARVESARHASEIHKKRTGHGLRACGRCGIEYGA